DGYWRSAFEMEALLVCWLGFTRMEIPEQIDPRVTDSLKQARTNVAGSAFRIVLQNNPKARAGPKALAQLDGNKRPLVSSLSGNLQRFEMERVAKVESRKSLLSSYYAHSWCPVSH